MGEGGGGAGGWGRGEFDPMGHTCPEASKASPTPPTPRQNPKEDT